MVSTEPVQSVVLPRRRLLGGAAAGAAALLTGTAVPAAAGTARSAGRGPCPPADVVLVHGAWHSSACWAKVTAPLSARGHRVLAVDLPGAGLNTRFPASYLRAGQPGLDQEPSPLREITLDDTALAVVDVLRSLRASGEPERPVVLVGHSAGGTTTTRVGQIAPELVDHLVYLAALAPTALGTGAAYLALPEQGPPSPGLYAGDPAVTGTARINPRSTDPAYQELLRTVFYGDVPTELYLAFGNGLAPDQPLLVQSGEVGATADAWGSIPRTYLRTLQDRALLPALQLRMIADADALTPGNPFRQITIDSSHSPFASRPEELARVLSDVEAR